MNRKFNRVPTGGSITIQGGQALPKPVARIVCRCAECLGPVDYYNNGVFCKAEPAAHRGLIHRKEAAILAQERQAALAQVETAYTINNGTIEPLTDILADRS